MEGRPQHFQWIYWRQIYIVVALPIVFVQKVLLFYEIDSYYCYQPMFVIYFDNDNNGNDFFNFLNVVHTKDSLSYLKLKRDHVTV